MKSDLCSFSGQNVVIGKLSWSNKLRVAQLQNTTTTSFVTWHDDEHISRKFRVEIFKFSVWKFEYYISFDQRNVAWIIVSLAASGGGLVDVVDAVFVFRLFLIEHE